MINYIAYIYIDKCTTNENKWPPQLRDKYTIWKQLGA